MTRLCRLVSVELVGGACVWVVLSTASLAFRVWLFFRRVAPPVVGLLGGVCLVIYCVRIADIRDMVVTVITALVCEVCGLAIH